MTRASDVSPPEDSAALNDRPIGVFDSGLGGLTVVQELLTVMPAENIVYLGDSARVPYGIKSIRTVRRFALEDMAFLLRFDPKMIVVACNTASAAAIEQLEAACPVDLVDVIRPCAAAAAAETPGPIGVIGTEATIASGAYQRAIAELDPTRRVIAKACPLLVPIVEEGRELSDPIVRYALDDYLGELKSEGARTLILGCTHYPLLCDAIGEIMGPDVTLISSARGAAVEVQQRLRSRNLQINRTDPGTLRCYTTDNPERFAQIGQRFGGRRIGHATLVGTDELAGDRAFSPERAR